MWLKVTRTARLLIVTIRSAGSRTSLSLRERGQGVRAEVRWPIWRRRAAADMIWQPTSIRIATYGPGSRPDLLRDTVRRVGAR
jgi:hypothetical protein